MKKGILLQIIIIFFLLIFWNALHLGFRLQKLNFEQSLSAKPMILIANEQASLEHLRSEIDSLYFISETLLEPDSLIATKLFQNYNLMGIENLISSFNLPSVMKIFIHSDQFNSFEKNMLETKVIDERDDIILQYDHNFWQEIKNKIKVLTSIYYGLNLIFIFFAMFFLITLRVHNEEKKNEFWKIYYAAGGSHKKRVENFWINSLLILFVPIILFAIVYAAALNFQYLPLTIYWWKFGFEFGILILIILFSRLMIGKNLK